MSRALFLRRLIVLAFAIAMLPTLALSVPAGAIVGGVVPSPIPAWNVMILNGEKNPVCSGSLIARQWVLTAAHCVRHGDTGDVLPASAFTVTVGKANASDNGFTTGVDLPPVSQAITYTTATGFLNDIALLHLASPVPLSWAPLPMRFATNAVPSGSQVQFVGWGGTRTTAAGRALFSTKPGDWTFKDSCYGNGEVCYARSSTATSYPSGGDSGSPIVSFVRGGWIQVGVFTGEGGLSAHQYGASTHAYLKWIRSHTGLPTVDANTIVRDQVSGASWLVESDGFRHWIPTGGDYLCFKSQNIQTVNMTIFQAKSIPEDYNVHATCGSATAPKSVAETSGGVLHTWTNYLNAGGTQGPSIPAFTTVQIACKVTGFKVSDGNTWWYLIAQSPWNSQYYASADGFYNNGRTSGSLHGTPFVDPNVPDCSGSVSSTTATVTELWACPGSDVHPTVPDQLTGKPGSGCNKDWAAAPFDPGGNLTCSAIETNGSGQSVAMALVRDGVTLIQTPPGYTIGSGTFYTWLYYTQTPAFPAGTYTCQVKLNDVVAAQTVFTISPGATSPQPAATSPPPAGTTLETTGGVTHTWTNYTNAGGTEGQTIPAFSSVQIACKLPGFKVADGNTWWYRIAQAPWSSQYYASADAFYNNGQTAGSLHGTPFVDPAVPSC